jgi:thiamine biosynthesis lipoprotein
MRTRADRNVSTLATESWSVWSCEAAVVVGDPIALAPAGAIVRDVIRQVDDACSRFRTDSELVLIAPSLWTGVTISPMLALLVAGALDAARFSEGAVDPTLGEELAQLGYDRDITELYAGADFAAAPVDIRITHRPQAWNQVVLSGSLLTVPAGISLDLGATAKAIAADVAATRVADELGCGVLVSLGGDIATAGSEPHTGWEVLVQDTDDDPSQQVSLAAGAAMATSSTQKRRWMSNGYARHHILDPNFGVPAEIVWRTVTVAAHSCLRANTCSTASIVRGFGAVGWLESLDVAARFVDVDGRVVTTQTWPTETRALSTSGSTG